MMLSSTADLVGQKFNKWTVQKRAKEDTPDRKPRWVCICDCGNTSTIRGASLRAGTSRGCGKGSCAGSYKHGYSNHELFSTYSNMISRCYDPDSVAYDNYGGRGIRVYKPWKKSIVTFITDIEQLLGKRPKNHELDRKDNNGHYEPNNLRWVPHNINLRNTRRKLTITINNVEYDLHEYYENRKSVVGFRTFRWRIRAGWNPKKARLTFSQSAVS